MLPRVGRNMLYLDPIHGIKAPRIESALRHTLKCFRCIRDVEAVRESDLHFSGSESDFSLECGIYL